MGFFCQFYVISSYSFVNIGKKVQRNLNKCKMVISIPFVNQMRLRTIHLHYESMRDDAERTEGTDLGWSLIYI